MAVLDYDGYTDRMSDPGYSIFIFLIGNEYADLDGKEHWVHSYYDNVHVVRLQPDETTLLDIGVHPYTMIYKDGKEHRHYMGIPNRAEIQGYGRKSYDYASRTSYDS